MISFAQQVWLPKDKTLYSENVHYGLTVYLMPTCITNTIYFMCTFRIRADSVKSQGLKSVIVMKMNVKGKAAFFPCSLHHWGKGVKPQTDTQCYLLTWWKLLFTAQKPDR